MRTDGKVNVENIISEKTHRPNALRFWVNMLYLSLLLFLLKYDVMVLGPPHDLTVVSEPSSARAPCIKSLSNKGVQIACFAEAIQRRCK